MKKKPVLLKRLLGERKEVCKTTIGLIGTHPGVGVTHTGILIANSLQKIGRSSIAYIEMGENSHIKYLQKRSHDGSCIQEFNKSLKICKITYYMSVSDRELLSILNEPYEYFIFDFGSDYRNNRNEFLRCNMKLVIGNFTEWRKMNLESFIEKNKDITGYKEWKYLIVFGSKDNINIARKQFHIHFSSVGYEPDLFVPTKEFLYLCEQIIC